MTASLTLAPSPLDDLMHRLGRFVLINNLVDDLTRRVALSRIDCVAEVKTFLAAASRRLYLSKDKCPWRCSRRYGRPTFGRRVRFST